MTDKTVEQTLEPRLEDSSQMNFETVHLYMLYPKFSREGEEARVRIQQELGVEAIPALIKNLKKGNLDSDKVLSLIRGLRGNEQELYNGIVDLSLTVAISESTDSGKLLDSLMNYVCALSPSEETFRLDVDKILSLARQNDRLTNQDKHIVESHIYLLLDDYPAIREMYRRGFLTNQQTSVRNYEDYFFDFPKFDKDSKKLGIPHVNMSEHRLSKEKKWKFASNGLEITIGNAPVDERYTVGGEHIEIKRGDLVGEIDFMPNSRGVYNKEWVLQTLAFGYKAMGDFLERIYEPQKFSEKDRLPYGVNILHGSTNLRMAEMAKRFGFQITDSSIPTRAVPKDIDGIAVVARIHDIKAAFDRFEKEKKGEKVLSRAIREKAIESGPA